MVWDGKKTICIDFDGVIHLYESGWKAHDIIEDGPHPEAFEMLAKYAEKFHVCVYSARSKDELGINAMLKWFRDHGMEEELLSKFQFPKQKPTASVYIDDRGWCFTGEWPTVAELEAFKPWNKR
jgi:hypothetical protein